jgi:tetratricopeptide (TPR) repeat protein
MCVVLYKVTAGKILASGSDPARDCPQKTGTWSIHKRAHRFVERFAWPGVVAFVCVLAAAVALVPETLGQDGSSPSTGISVTASEQIFDTICALDAAGFEANENTLGDMPARLALRADLLKLQGPATAAVRSYYSGHPDANPDALLSRYITFALVTGPPPDFTFQLSEDELPPEALSLEDFQPLLSAFYQEANLGPRWKSVEPEYDTLEGNYRSIVRNTVVKTNSYLREIVAQNSGRAFTVYVEPLAGNATNFRNFGDQYAVVVGARPSDSAALIQHAYLHFMLDPLVLKDRNALQAKSPLLDIAARAPQLPEEFKTDFISFADECVIKAVELRLRELPAGEEEVALRQDDESGFVMVRPLVNGLVKFEKDNPSMTYYLPDLINAVDVRAETTRLQGVRFAAVAEPAESAAKPAASAESDNEALLEQGNREIALRDGDAAAEIFKKVLASSPNDPRALYGLALASVLSGHAEDGRALFEQVVASATPSDPGAKAGGQPADPDVLAWSHVYLGRIHDLEGDRDLAVGEYKAALAVSGAPESARVAAQRGVDQAYGPPAGGNNSQ